MHDWSGLLPVEATVCCLTGYLWTKCMFLPSCHHSLWRCSKCWRKRTFKSC